MSPRTSIVPYLRRTPLLWVGGFLLACGLVLGSLGLAVSIEDARFAADGATAQGIVLSKDIKHSTNSSRTSYSIHYRFTLPGDLTYEGSSSIDASDWDALVESGPVAVQYLVSDPSFNRIPGTGDLIFAVLFLALGVGLASGGSALVWRASRTLREDRRLLRVGTEARATVAAVEPTNISINRRLQWVISYAYRDASGNDHEGRSWMMPADEAEKFSPGDQGSILYDPDQPAQSLWVYDARPMHPAGAAIDDSRQAPRRRHIKVDAPAPSVSSPLSGPARWAATPRRTHRPGRTRWEHHRHPTPYHLPRFPRPVSDQARVRASRATRQQSAGRREVSPSGWGAQCVHASKFRLPGRDHLTVNVTVCASPLGAYVTVAA